MSKKIFFLLLLVATLILAVVIIRFWLPEDTWLCSDGQWVRHGNPSASMPTTVCPGIEATKAITEATDDQESTTAIGLANPASVNCVDRGGELQIEKRSDGGEFGVCYFEDNRQCEEWALLRGACPVGGRKVTGYLTEAGRYCAITGGVYRVITSGDETSEKGECDLPGGTTCGADDYYNGICPVLTE